MTDPKTGSNLVTVNLPGGGERNLKKLGPSDWVRLGNTLRASRKARKRQELAEAGAAAETVKAEMDAMDRRPVKHADIEAYVNEPEGQFTAILLSIAKDHPPGVPPGDLESEFEALELEPPDWLPLTASLLRMEGGPERPLAGNGNAGETANPSGGDYPTSSADTSTSLPGNPSVGTSSSSTAA